MTSLGRLAALKHLNAAKRLARLSAFRRAAEIARNRNNTSGEAIAAAIMEEATGDREGKND